MKGKVGDIKRAMGHGDVRQRRIAEDDSIMAGDVEDGVLDIVAKPVPRIGIGFLLHGMDADGRGNRGHRCRSGFQLRGRLRGRLLGWLVGLLGLNRFVLLGRLRLADYAVELGNVDLERYRLNLGVRELGQSP